MVDALAPEYRVFDEHDFRRLLAWEVQRASRYQDFLSLCLARFEHPGGPSRNFLDTMAQRVVKLLRATDVVALQDDDSIAIMLVHTPESDARTITDRVRGLLEGLALRTGPDAPAVTAVLTLGLASFPTDATSDRALLEKAQTRLATARRDTRGSPPTA